VLDRVDELLVLALGFADLFFDVVRVVAPRLLDGSNEIVGTEGLHGFRDLGIKFSFGHRMPLF